MDAITVMPTGDDVAQVGVTEQPQIRAGPPAEGFDAALESAAVELGPAEDAEGQQGGPEAQTPESAESAVKTPRLVAVAMPALPLDLAELIDSPQPAREGRETTAEGVRAPSVGRPTGQPAAAEPGFAPRPRVGSLGPTVADPTERVEPGPPAQFPRGDTAQTGGRLSEIGYRSPGVPEAGAQPRRVPKAQLEPRIGGRDSPVPRESPAPPSSRSESEAAVTGKDAVIAVREGGRGEPREPPQVRPSTAPVQAKPESAGDAIGRGPASIGHKPAEVSPEPKGPSGATARVFDGVEVKVDAPVRQAGSNGPTALAASRLENGEQQPASQGESEADEPAVRQESRASTRPEVRAGRQPEAARPQNEARAEPAAGAADRPTAQVRTSEGAAKLEGSREPIAAPEAPEPIRQVAHEIRRMVVDPQRHTAEIRLVPEHLGRLRLSVRVTGDKVQVAAFASTPQAQAALDSGSADLRESLEDLGYTLESFKSEVDQNAGHQTHKSEQEVPGLTAITHSWADEGEPERTIARIRDPERLLDVFV